MSKRKKYVPRAAVKPITFGLTETDRQNLVLPVFMSLEDLCAGRGTERDGHQIAAAINIAAVVSRNQPLDAQQAMQAALTAAAGVMARGKEQGKWGVSGDQYQAIRQGVDLYDQMTQVVPRRELRQALAQAYLATEPESLREVA